jgi:hypothetical protein
MNMFPAARRRDTEHELPVCVPGELGELVEAGDEPGRRLAESGHGMLLLGQVAGGAEIAAFGLVGDQVEGALVVGERGPGFAGAEVHVGPHRPYPVRTP